MARLYVGPRKRGRHGPGGRGGSRRGLRLLADRAARGGVAEIKEFTESAASADVQSEGDRYGAGIAGGYSRMLGRHINLDLGIGLWTGYTRYVTYACPTCGRIIGSGKGIFILPNDITLGLSYIF